MKTLEALIRSSKHRLYPLVFCGTVEDHRLTASEPRRAAWTLSNVLQSPFMSCANRKLTIQNLPKNSICQKNVVTAKRKNILGSLFTRQCLRKFVRSGSDHVSSLENLSSFLRFVIRRPKSKDAD